MLVEAGAEVDHADAQGLTALCAAAHRGQVDAVRVMLEDGADPNRATNNGLAHLAFARAYS
jgi:ankyrin repeat protein